MRFRNLKNKLLAGVTATVLVSGLIISVLVIQRYSSSLRQSVIIQARYLTEAVAREAADLVLTDDLAGLQRLLERQPRSNPSLKYLFVSRNARILAHTFATASRRALSERNHPLSGEKPSML